MDNYGHLDYETQSVPDLEEVGLDVYLEHPWTRIIQANYARGERAVKTWEPHLNPKIPSELEDMLLDPFCSLYSWGANFERQITKRCLGIDKPTTEWVCVMAASRYAGLPGRLEEAGTVLGLGDEAKLESGKELIKLFCEPVDIGGEDTLFGISEPTFNTPYTHPQEWKQFCEYGKRDIIAERAALKKIRPFWPSEEEWETWRYDSKWNETGWPVDLLLVRNAREIALRSRQPLLDRMKELTGLSNVESRNQVLGWVQPHGYLFDSLGKEFIARALAGECEMSPEGREVLELRLQTAKSSVSKYTTLADMTSSDARLRFQYTYYGAHTGRWCLAEGTPVTVKTTEGVVRFKPIQKVLLSDLVWDGEEWVKHDGVVYSGDKNTILYEGVEATPEHEVWVSPEKKMPLGEAKEKEISLWRGKPAYEIYRLTSPSGKSYIGLTNMGVRERWKKHIWRAFNDSRSGNHPFYNAIRKYGPETFLTEVIDYALSKKQAQQLEVDHIAAHPKNLLYNISPGGEADGEAGATAFWKRMEDDPKEKEAYIQKLSETQKSRGVEAFEHLSSAAQIWREDHPKKAYKQSSRALRKSPSHKNPKAKDDRSLVEKLRWKHDRPKAVSVVKQDWWDNATEERRSEIAHNVSEGKKKEWENKTPTEQQEMLERLDKMQKSVDRSVQGPAASKGLKKFWEDLKKDPERYQEYIDTRARTLKKTLEAKYANV